MAHRPRQSDPEEPYGFRLDLTIYLETGDLPEAFFERLRRLVRARIKEKHKPQLFEISASGWDKETLWDLALRFLTEHLAPQTGGKWPYLLDRVAEGRPVDGLMIRMFDQFVAEVTRRRVPNRANLRARVRSILKDMARTGEIHPAREKTGCWASKTTPCRNPMTLQDLQDMAEPLPAFEIKRYDGEERVSPVLSDGDLRELLSAIFREAQGCIPEDVLVDFVFDTLNVSDVRWEALDDLGKDETDWELQARKLGHFDQGEQEAWTLLHEGWPRLSPRQKSVVKQHFLEGRSLPEICATLGISKSVLYDEISAAKCVLSGDAPEKGKRSPLQENRKRDS
jgi:hypothetical protein